MPTPVRSRLIRGTVALAVTSGALLLPATGAQAADTATVSILHAVPGATVDVYANGKELLSDFKPGTLTDPQPLPAGTYDLKVVAAGDGADGDAVAELDDAKVPAGANVTVVAHLNASGDPRLTAYANDTSGLDAGQARLIVRHDAAAPAVDVRADEEVAFSGLENPDEDSADLDAGTISADVVLAGERPGHRPGRREPQGGHDHDRVRVGLRRGRQPEAGRPDDQRHGRQPGRRPRRHRRPGGGDLAARARRPRPRRGRPRRPAPGWSADGGPPGSDGHGGSRVSTTARVGEPAVTLR